MNLSEVMDITNKVGPTNRRKPIPSLILHVCCFILTISVSQAFAKVYALEGSCFNNTVCDHKPWIEPYPICRSLTCICENSTCLHHTLNEDGDVNQFCGECGIVGAGCLDSSECRFPTDHCSRNGYCYCRSGYLQDDICIHYQPVTTTKESILLIIILIFLLLLYKIVSSWKTFKQIICRLCCCRRICRNCGRGYDSDEEVAYGHNSQSRDKSPAYTISSREFLASSDDPDLEWALALSTMRTSNFSHFGREEIGRSESFRRPHLYRSYQSDRRRNRREDGAPCVALRHESFSSDASSISSSSSSRCILNTCTTCTSTDGSSSSSLPIATPTGTIQRIRSVPAGNRRKRVSDSGYAFCGCREEVIINRIIKNASTASTSSVDSSTSSSASASENFRIADSVPLSVRRKRRETEYVPFNDDETHDATCCSSSESTPTCNRSRRSTMSQLSFYSSVRSNFSDASSPSTRPKNNRNRREDFHGTSKSSKRNPSLDVNALPFVLTLEDSQDVHADDMKENENESSS